MCEPASIIAITGAVVAAVTSAVSAGVSAEMEKQAIEAENEANIAQANMLIDETNDLAKQEGIAEQNEQKATSEKAMQMKRDNLIKAGTAKAASQAEGNASKLVANEYARSLGQDMSVLKQNLKLSGDQHNIARNMFYKSANNQIGQMKGKKQTNAGVYVANALIGTAEGAVNAAGSITGTQNKHSSV